MLNYFFYRMNYIIKEALALTKLLELQQEALFRGRVSRIRISWRSHSISSTVESTFFYFHLLLFKINHLFF